MGNLATVVRLGVALMPYLVDYVWAQQDVSRECVESKGGCLRCRGEHCARCAVLLHRGSCVDSCPRGHTAVWSTRDEYMGRICNETGYMFGLTGSQVAILVGVVSGATICIFIILCGAIVVHQRKKKAAKMVRQFEDSAERREFLKHLATLRGEGHTFLAMLNDTRRQVRELYYSGDNGDGAVGIQAYRPVLRDLARILVLVNKKDEEIPLPPDDWQRLLAWAERLLRRYKKHSSPEVAQLVTFLQQPTVGAPSVGSPSSPSRSPSLTLSTQQPITISSGQPPPPSQQQQQPFELRSTPTNLTTFQANAPLATFQASDKSSISPASSSLGYTKDSGGSPVGSWNLGPNGSSLYNSEKLSPAGSTIGQTTPLVYTSQKRHHRHNHRHRHHQPVGSHLQELAISAFNHNYNTTSAAAAADAAAGLPTSDSSNLGGSVDDQSSGLDRELNPQWEFRSSIDEASYTILSDWTPGRDCLIDDFTILGFRPQDEITTEL